MSQQLLLRASKRLLRRTSNNTLITQQRTETTALQQQLINNSYVNKLFYSTHDDFKAKSHVIEENIQAVIAEDVKKETVVIFMKGSPNAPQCGFSNVACRILDHYGVPYASRNVLASESLRNGIKTYSNWPTIPQVFIGGEFLGGSDILMTMHQDGSLKTELEKAGLTIKTTTTTA